MSMPINMTKKALLGFMLRKYPAIANVFYTSSVWQPSFSHVEYLIKVKKRDTFSILQSYLELVGYYLINARIESSPRGFSFRFIKE